MIFHLKHYSKVPICIFSSYSKRSPDKKAILTVLTFCGIGNDLPHGRLSIPECVIILCRLTTETPHVCPACSP